MWKLVSWDIILLGKETGGNILSDSVYLATFMLDPRSYKCRLKTSSGKLPTRQEVVAELVLHSPPRLRVGVRFVVKVNILEVF